MFRSFRGKIAFSGVAVLVLGILLLVFTFISAYGFLTESFDIIASGDLVQTFGEALAPLIATCIRIMYLGVMGWIASLITIRGVTIIANAPKLDTGTPPKPLVSPLRTIPSAAKPKPEPQREKPPESRPAEPKPPEPEIIVIPPEQVAPQQTQPQSQDPQPQSNNQQNSQS